jgi:rRNA maturation endonuclease Nob1
MPEKDRIISIRNWADKLSSNKSSDSNSSPESNQDIKYLNARLLITSFEPLSFSITSANSIIDDINNRALTLGVNELPDHKRDLYNVLRNALTMKQDIIEVSQTQISEGDIVVGWKMSKVTIGIVTEAMTRNQAGGVVSMLNVLNISDYNIKDLSSHLIYSEFKNYNDGSENNLFDKRTSVLLTKNVLGVIRNQDPLSVNQQLKNAIIVANILMLPVEQVDDQNLVNKLDNTIAEVDRFLDIYNPTNNDRSNEQQISNTKPVNYFPKLEDAELEEIKITSTNVDSSNELPENKVNSEDLSNLTSAIQQSLKRTIELSNRYMVANLKLTDYLPVTSNCTAQSLIQKLGVLQQHYIHVGNGSVESVRKIRDISMLILAMHHLQ